MPSYFRPKFEIQLRKGVITDVLGTLSGVNGILTFVRNILQLSDNVVILFRRWWTLSLIFVGREVERNGPLAVKGTIISLNNHGFKFCFSALVVM